MYQKLMVTQAEVDSLEVNDLQVEGELDRRLGSFIQQFGSQEKLEEYYETFTYCHCLRSYAAGWSNTRFCTFFRDKSP